MIVGKTSINPTERLDVSAGRVCPAGSSLSGGPHAQAGATLADAAARFLERMARGQVRNRRGAAYLPSTQAAYRYQLNRRVLTHRDPRLQRPLGEIAACDIDSAVAQGMVDELVRTHGTSIARGAHSALGAVLADWADDSGVASRRPVCAHLPYGPVGGSGLALRPADCERLLRAARAEDARGGRSLFGPLVAAVLGTGLSLRETARLAWGPDGLDLDVAPPQIRLVRIDAGEPVMRIVTVPDATAVVLRAHRELNGAGRYGDPVFALASGRPLLRLDTIYATLRRLAAEAGIAGFTPTRLRHAAGTLDALELERALAAAFDDLRAG